MKKCQGLQDLKLPHSEQLECIQQADDLCKYPLFSFTTTCIYQLKFHRRINIRGRSPIRLMQDQLLNQWENRKKIKLRRLSLRGYKEITNDALVCIQNLNLDLLDVTYTKVTKEGISKFLNLNPNCRVIHPSYCVCKPLILC